MLKKPENWTGKIEHTVSGLMSSSSIEYFDFTINIDGTITGTMMEDTHSTVKTFGMETTLSIPNMDSNTTPIAITGDLNEPNNTVNLVTHVDKVHRQVNMKGWGSILSGIINPRGRSPFTATDAHGNVTHGYVDGAELPEEGDWSLPPIKKESGGTVTTTTSSSGIIVTTVYTIYPVLEIIRLDRDDKTFLADNTELSFKVKVNKHGLDPNTTQWAVTGKSKDSGDGDPHTANNTSVFSFKPNPKNRPTLATDKKGSTKPNDPIKYTIEASVGGFTETLDLEQDETDIIRQEYVDYKIPIPIRDVIKKPTNRAFNNGNYTLIIDMDLQHHLDEVVARFQTICIGVVPIPGVSVTSGYRNPRKNSNVGSIVPNSKHTYGSALDIKPVPFNPDFLNRLRDAATLSGIFGMEERGSDDFTTIKSNGKVIARAKVNDDTVRMEELRDHVHIQW